MKRLMIAVLLAAACARTDPNGPALYVSRDDAFSATLPGGWRVDDSPGETRKAAFFGPPAGERPFAEMIRVSLRPGATPEGYRGSVQGLPTPLAETSAGGAKAWEFLSTYEFHDPHAGIKKFATRAVLVPSSAGLYVLEHSWPAGTDGSRAAFDALLASFKPKAP